VDHSQRCHPRSSAASTASPWPGAAASGGVPRWPMTPRRPAPQICFLRYASGEGTQVAAVQRLEPLPPTRHRGLRTEKHHAPPRGPKWNLRD
jgi:hypothetical protein